MLWRLGGENLPLLRFRIELRIFETLRDEEDPASIPLASRPYVHTLPRYQTLLNRSNWLVMRDVMAKKEKGKEKEKG